jgi:hypothetical protein
MKAVIADGVLELEVRDDGVPGADSGGRGLVGLADRVGAVPAGILGDVAFARWWPTRR